MLEGLEAGGKVEDFDVGGAVGPVVAPADDYVAARLGMIKTQDKNFVRVR
jgi:hypothetical protein